VIDMPTYEYRCDECETNFDAWQGINDDPLTECRACGSANIRRLISAGGGLVFKGTGFYATDYRSGSASDGSSDRKGDRSKSEDRSKSGESSNKSDGSDGGKAESGGKAGDD
jgi:putative FmdB family regulatory protein